MRTTRALSIVLAFGCVALTCGGRLLGTGAKTEAGEIELQADAEGSDSSTGLREEDFQNFNSRRLLRGGHMQYGPHSQIYKMTPDEKYLLTGGRYRYLSLWDVATGERVWEIDVDKRVLNSADFTPDGRHFLVPIYTGKIHIHHSGLFSFFESILVLCETKTGKRVKVFKFPNEYSGINNVFVCADGRSMLTSGNFAPIVRWTLSIPGKKGTDPKEIKALVKKLGDDSYEVRKDAYDRLWEIGEDALDALKEAQKSPDQEVASQAIKLIQIISSSTPVLMSEFKKSDPVVYDKKQGRITMRAIPLVMSTGRKRVVCPMQAIPEGKKYYIRAWEVETGNCIFNKEVKKLASYVDISPGGQWIAYDKGNEMIGLYQFDSEKKAYVEYALPSGRVLFPSGSLQFTPDGRHLLGHHWRKDTITVYSVPDFERVGNIKTEWNPPYGFRCVSPRGTYLLTYKHNFGCMLHKFTGSSATPIETKARLQYGDCGDLSPDGTLVANMLADKKTCLVRNVATGKTVFRQKFDWDITTALMLGANNRYLVAGAAMVEKKDGGSSHTITVQGRFFKVFEIATGKVVWEDSVAAGSKQCKVLAMTPDGRHLYTLHDKTVQLREIKSGKVLKIIPYKAIALYISSDGKRCLFVSDRSVVLWDTVNWKEIWKIDMKISRLRKTAVFSQDEKTALISARFTLAGGRQINGVAKVDVKTGEISIVTKMSASGIHFFDGKYAVISQSDHLEIWDMENSKHVISLGDCGGDVLSVRIKEGIKRMRIASENGSVWEWYIPAPQK